MASGDRTPRNSVDHAVPDPNENQDSSSEDEASLSPKTIKSLLGSPPAKIRPSILPSFSAPSDQVLDSVMDPNQPSSVLFNIVADREFCFFQPQSWIKDAVDNHRSVTSTIDTRAGKQFFGEIHATTSAMSGSTDKPYMSRKKRRTSSNTKGLIKDFLGVVDMPKVMKKLCCHMVYYSDKIIKVNRKGKAQERILVVTENSICNLEPKTYECKRQIPFIEISKISSSLLHDNFFIIHVPKEYDYLMVSSNKIEIISLVSLLYLWACGDPLKVAFMNLIEYTADKEKKQQKQVHFTNHEEGVYTEISCNPINK